MIPILAVALAAATALCIWKQEWLADHLDRVLGGGDNLPDTSPFGPVQAGLVVPDALTEADVDYLVWLELTFTKRHH